MHIYADLHACGAMCYWSLHTGIRKKHTYLGHAQTQPSMSRTAHFSYAELQTCIRSTQGDYAIICKSAETHRSTCCLPLTGLCVPEPCSSSQSRNVYSDSKTSFLHSKSVCWVCAMLLIEGEGLTQADADARNNANKLKLQCEHFYP